MLLLIERLALPRGDARVIAAGTTSTGHPARSANRDPVARLVVAAKGDRSGFKHWLTPPRCPPLCRAGRSVRRDAIERRDRHRRVEARRVNEAKPFTSREDGRLLRDTVARADALSIMNLKLPARTGPSVPASPPSPLFGSYTHARHRPRADQSAAQLNHRAREAAGARAQEELRRRRAGGH
ncbi:MAG TPA: hypothetical protein VK251_04180 [Steroidobacteraceae bacterium]|nr:hypothetical protein [Steroidobacteraceae bacterium]